jgi:probable rRNA maturation factor
MSSPEGSSVTFRRVPSDVRPGAIQHFARKLQREVSKGRPFDTLITGDAELRQLNRDFRSKDYATDVLSFPAGAGQGSGARGQGPEALGDIAISVARARAQGRQFGHSTEDEIRILMLHGLLHLLGMDHENDNGAMARREKRWRSRLELPNGLIERLSGHGVRTPDLRPLAPGPRPPSSGPRPLTPGPQVRL